MFSMEKGRAMPGLFGLSGFPAIHLALQIRRIPLPPAIVMFGQQSLNNPRAARAPGDIAYFPP
jgi:hypothetical protein